MKKIFLVASVFATVALTSCKKDYKCSCTYTSTIPGSGSSTQEFTIVDATKSTAKKACIKTTSDDTFGGTTYTSTSDCKLN